MYCTSFKPTFTTIDDDGLLLGLGPFFHELSLSEVVVWSLSALLPSSLGLCFSFNMKFDILTTGRDVVQGKLAPARPLGSCPYLCGPHTSGCLCSQPGSAPGTQGGQRAPS